MEIVSRSANNGAEGGAGEGLAVRAMTDYDLTGIENGVVLDQAAMARAIDVHDDPFTPASPRNDLALSGGRQPPASIAVPRFGRRSAPTAG
jgi:hypothetical protein